MGCNCGRRKTAPERWVLTMPSGRKSVHGTRRSAELANDRAGGDGKIRREGD